MAETEEYLSVEQIQALLNVSEATAWNYIRRYNLPRFRIPARGRKTLVRKRDLMRALEQPIPVEKPTRKKRQGKAAA